MLYATLKEYIESKRGTPPNKTIADYVLDNKVLTELDFAFIDTLYQENKKSRPFKGMRILFNMHQDRATWLLMFYYEALGAQVEASNFNLSELPFTADVLEKSNIPYYQNQLPSQTRDYYHHIVDCGAGALASFDPEYGMAELTQTLPHLYKKIRFPVISVNETASKEAETKGTGEGGLAALPSAIIKHITDNVGRANDALTIKNKMAVYNARFEANFYIIIGGNGKVGRGFARALLHKEVKQSHILLVDTKKTNDLSIPFLENEQGELVSLDDKQAFKQAILAHMQKTEPTENYTLHNFAEDIALVTATGVRNLLTDKGYSPADFNSKHTWFINMGQPDEYGANFSKDVMAGDWKGPLNFHPQWLAENGFATKTKHLMPCWGALAQSSLYAVTHKLNRGISPTPAMIDQKMVNLAMKIYGNAGPNSPSRSHESSSSKNSANDSTVPTSPDRNKDTYAPSTTQKKRDFESATVIETFLPSRNAQSGRRLRSADKAGFCPT